MTVQELIDLLEDCDPDARVLLMTQPRWPLEYELAGVTTRGDAEDADDDRDDDDDSASERDRERGTAETDVFLLEGQQLRYGTAAAWRARR